MASKYVSTPVGAASYPHITKPSEKYKKYELDLLLDPQAAEKLIAQIDEFIDDNFKPKDAKTTKRPYKEVDGKLAFKFRSQYQPKVYDSSGNLIDASKMPNIWAGSELRINGGLNANEDKNSVSIFLNEVQIVKLVSGGGGGGFGKVEGGYVATGGDDHDDEEEGDSAPSFGTSGEKTEAPRSALNI